MTVARARVAVVQPHVLLAESLGRALTAEGFAATLVPVDGMTATALLDPILAVEPRVVMLELDLGGAGDGMVLVRPLQQAGCRVVVTAADDPARWGEALALGAHSVLSESAQLVRVLEVLRRAVAGEPAMSKPERLDLINRWRVLRVSDDHHRAHLRRLSPREREVLSRLAAGQQVSAIARDLCVAESTVRTQVKSILAKLKVNSQIAAIAIAHDMGWRSWRAAPDPFTSSAGP
jgi:two-component system, NarL family, nitrate/nitrite response regulator NarL